MLSLAIPGVIMVIAEFLAFEVLTILAARFGTESLAAQSIASNVASLAFQLPFAIAVVLSTNIGNYVGSKNVLAAKLMAPRRRFDKKNATAFNIVHRAHDDAKFYDEEASEHVLVPATSSKTTPSDSKKKIYTPNELKEKLGEIRENEGLAAQYGIFYDDSKYDYMQHLKPMGETQDGVFVGVNEENKGKTKIEDLFQGQLPSEQTRKVGHDLNESIPKELQGFNPNLDPRLREVLEALDDEAYVEEEGANEEGDIFDDLLKSGEVEDEDEFYYGSDAGYDEDYDEWDLDNYQEEYNEKYELGEPVEYDHEEFTDEVPEIHQNWQGVMKFKQENKNKENEWDSDDDFEEEEEEQDAVGELPTINSKPKKSNTKLRKKKGAMTDTSSFSMSSSALFRTEGLTLLDDRYEQLNKQFANDLEQEEIHSPFNLEEERNDFESMLDDFLDNYELESGGRKLAKKDEEKKKIQTSADSVSRGKVAKARMKELSSSLNNMKI
ncbi:Protein LTV1 [Spathaspora sp. JA1]|nr:Protein LTV1 [Spathaspora sp. JA1]